MERYISYGRKFLTSFTAVFTCIIWQAPYSSDLLKPVPAISLDCSGVGTGSRFGLSILLLFDKPFTSGEWQCGPVYILAVWHWLFCAWQFEWFSFSHTQRSDLPATVSDGLYHSLAGQFHRGSAGREENQQAAYGIKLIFHG